MMFRIFECPKVAAVCAVAGCCFFPSAFRFSFVLLGVANELGREEQSGGSKGGPQQRPERREVDQGRGTPSYFLS